MKNQNNLHRFFLKVGARLLPFVNNLASAMNAFKYSNMSFEMGIDMFPGQERCDNVSSHSIWHHEEAIALVDLVFLADELDRLIISYGPQTRF